LELFYSWVACAILVTTFHVVGEIARNFPVKTGADSFSVEGLNGATGRG